MSPVLLSLIGAVSLTAVVGAVLDRMRRKHLVRLGMSLTLTGWAAIQAAALAIIASPSTEQTGAFWLPGVLGAVGVLGLIASVLDLTGRRPVRSLVLSLVVVVAAAGGGLAAAGATGSSPELGLDLQGGISVVLEPATEADEGQLDQAVSIIRRRVDSLGVAEPEITRQGDAIIVQIPGVENREQVLELIGTTAELRFRPVLQQVGADSFFGEGESGQGESEDSGEASGDEASGDGQGSGDEATGDGQGSGDEATGDEATGDEATGDGQDSGDEASGDGQGSGDEATGDGQDSGDGSGDGGAAGQLTPPEEDAAGQQVTLEGVDGDAVYILGPTPCVGGESGQVPGGQPSIPGMSVPGGQQGVPPQGGQQPGVPQPGGQQPGGQPGVPQPGPQLPGQQGVQPLGGGQQVGVRQVAGQEQGGDQDTNQGDGQGSGQEGQGDGQGRGGGEYCADGNLATGRIVDDAQAGINQTGSAWEVRLTMRSGEEGIDTFNQVAATCNGGAATCPTGQLAIVLDSQVQSAPVIQQPSYERDQIVISGGSGQSQGGEEADSGFTEQEARDLALVLRYGSLPVELERQSVETVSATLGEDSLRAGIVAGLVGFALVALYMIFYYRLLGAVAIAGLALWGALMYGVIAWLGVTQGLALTLAGATGIIISVGVTVDSYVVYFERLKDEVKMGRTLRSSAERAFNQSFRTILAANAATFIGAVVLWRLTAGAVRGFAFYLGLSTVLGVLVTWMFTRPVVRLLSRGRLGTARRGGVASGLTGSTRPAVEGSG